MPVFLVCYSIVSVACDRCCFQFVPWPMPVFLVCYSIVSVACDRCCFQFVPWPMPVFLVCCSTVSVARDRCCFQFVPWLMPMCSPDVSVFIQAYFVCNCFGKVWKSNYMPTYFYMFSAYDMNSFS